MILGEAGQTCKKERKRHKHLYFSMTANLREAICVSEDVLKTVSRRKWRLWTRGKDTDDKASRRGPPDKVLMESHENQPLRD